MGHEDAVYLAKLAEQAERYEGSFIFPFPGRAWEVTPSVLTGYI
jgi:hypothetical protein